MMEEKNELPSASGRSERMARTGANVLLSVKRQSMDLLQRGYEKLPPRYRLLVLAVGFAAGMFCCGMLILRPGLGKNSSLKSLFRDAAVIKVAPIPPTAVENPAYRRIRRARLYLDSLEGTEAGRKQLDSILRGRPGLRDSLRMADEMIRRE